MKRILLALFFVVNVMAADTQSSAKFIVTGIPLDGDTFVFQGTTRTWKTVVTTAGTQVQIGGTAAISANNMATEIAAYPLNSTATMIQQSVTNIILIEQANTAVTASRTGTWGTVAVNTSSLTQRGISLPFTTESPATRTNDANDLVLAFGYATSQFGASYAALANFVNTSAAQTIAGAKTYTGANIYSNVNQMFISGIISNTATTNLPFAHALKLLVTQGAYLNGASLDITNSSPAIRLYDNEGSADQKRTYIQSDTSGFSVAFWNDAATLNSNVFSIGRNSTYGGAGASFGTTLTAPLIFSTILSNSTTTNMQFIHATNALIQNAMFTAPLSVSNAAPILTLNETDAGTDLKQFQFRSAAGVLTLYMATDAGSVGVNQKVWSVERPGLDALTTDSLFHFFSPVTFDSTVTLNGGLGLNISADGKIGGGLVVGSTTETPNSFSIRVLDGGSPIADPATGFGLWSNGQGMKYRTDAVGEGDGHENFVFNRTGTISGAGTDYTLTGSTAFVDFGTTDPKITLPTDGTYLIWADVALTAGGTANDDYRFKLRNETASTDLSGSDQEITYLGSSQLGQVKMQATTTGTAGDVIAIWGFNNTAARGTINSARTRIGYVRLY